MNGEFVGTWSKTTADIDVFKYHERWLQSERTRPLSLTLPFLPDNEAHRGPHVASWFENLLPDSHDIRTRLARRFGVSASARSLLAEIGRDCVGAVQILPAGDAPTESNTLDIETLTTADVARVLRGVTSTKAFTFDDAEEFRISIAGAQEKTALLYRNGTWYRPRGSTPTTHILKLPLGLVGNMKYDLTHSIENEWLCLHLLEALGFPVAKANMATFTDDVSIERVLVVERFDRAWVDARKSALIRLPQEDFCQATARSPNQRYESEGGPAIKEIRQILQGGIAPQEDVRTFVLAQLAFWLLAATDGHAKNFSLFVRRDGYALTPLYDVISAWPIIGKGPNNLPMQKAKLAMALRCKNAHYEISRILVRHWKCLADQSGMRFDEMEHLVERVPSAIDSVANILPPDFPHHIWITVTDGLRANMKRFKH